MPSTRDQHPYNVAYYARNRDAEIARVTVRQQATLAWLRELRTVPCMDCGGIFPPYVMDFDHRDPKTKLFNLGAGKSLLKNRALLEAEVAKCDIVCVNCHRIRTHTAFMNGTMRPLALTRRAEGGTKHQIRSREKFRRMRETHADLLRSLRVAPCLDCGRTFPWFVMEFDHLDAPNKTALVTRMIGRVRTEVLLNEVAKCDIVCANCHRERTYHRRACMASNCPRVWCSGHARDPSKVEGRVRFPSPAQQQLRLIEESATPYRYAA